jgi:hypothetical protein
MVMLSRSARAKLVLIPVIGAILGSMWLAYGPRGYRYEFQITSETLEEAEPGRPASALPPQRWKGYGLERHVRLPIFRRRDASTLVTESGRIPVLADTLARNTSFRTHTGRRELGRGEVVAGFSTRRYLLTADDTVYIRDGGGQSRLARISRTETFVWVTDEVENVGRRFMFLADSVNMIASGRSPRAVRQRQREGSPSFDGVPVKFVSTAVTFDSLGRRRETVTTSEIVGFERRRVGRVDVESLRALASRQEYERRGRALMEGARQKS